MVPAVAVRGTRARAIAAGFAVAAWGLLGVLRTPFPWISGMIVPVCVVLSNAIDAWPVAP